MNNKEILQKLINGNNKYLDASYNDALISKTLRKETFENGQHPFGIVITCSDSRVIPEAIFNLGIGEIFTIRLAGNVVDNGTMASVEYAVCHLNCKLIIVMGHTNCGAISSASSNHLPKDGYLKIILEDIYNATKSGKTLLEKTELNILNSINKLKNNPIINKQNDLEIIGCIYDTETGKVNFLKNN